MKLLAVAVAHCSLCFRLHSAIVLLSNLTLASIVRFLLETPPQLGLLEGYTLWALLWAVRLVPGQSKKGHPAGVSLNSRSIRLDVLFHVSSLALGGEKILTHQRQIGPFSCLKGKIINECVLLPLISVGCA